MTAAGRGAKRALGASLIYLPDMPRKPVSIEVIEEGDARHVVLTYADGEVVKRPVESGRKARRRPRRPQTRLSVPVRKER